MATVDMSNKRKNYFIDKPFQFKFILQFSLLVMLGGFAAALFLYYVSRGATSISIVDSRVVVRSTADFLLPVLVQTIVVVFTVTALATIGVTLFVSHKIAGPMYRFKKVLEGVRDGDFSRGFTLRSDDQIKDVADSMNAMIKANCGKIGAIKALAVKLNADLAAIAENDVYNEKQAVMAEVRRAAKELKDISEQFKA